jgi:hypothetical protein
MLAATDKIVPSPVDAVGDLPVFYADGCQVPAREVDPLLCEYGDAEGELTLALVGDSKAAQWGSAFIELADRHGWRLISLTKSTCALTSSLPHRDDGPYPECMEWGRAVLELFQEDPPDIVVVSQGGSMASLGDEEPSSDAMVQGMVDAYESLSAIGVEVVILVDNPHPGFTVYECVAENPDNLAACTFERSERLASGARAVQEEAARRGDYPKIDMFDAICPTETCLPVIGEVLVYRQGSHLTDTYVRSLIGRLEDELRAVLPPSFFRSAG